MSHFGPRPWIQHHWDWRVAGNFVLGGSGSGLLLTAALVLPRTAGQAQAIVAGLMLVGAGLGLVWTEIGRPARVLHVYFNPRTSWMSREAIAGTVLFVAGGLALLVPGTATASMLAGCAAVFVFCQARMLAACKGIPAWRAQQIVPFMLVTALAEGAALAVLLTLPQSAPGAPLYGLLAVLLPARMWAWHSYVSRVAPQLDGAARDALRRAGTELLVPGTLLALAAMVPSLVLSGAISSWSAVLAALAAILPGWRARYLVMLRAAQNCGFSLPAQPVRGTR